MLFGVCLFGWLVFVFGGFHLFHYVDEWIRHVKEGRRFSCCVKDGTQERGF